jgi:hypothetical protein
MRGTAAAAALAHRFRTALVVSFLVVPGVPVVPIVGILLGAVGVPPTPVVIVMVLARPVSRIAIVVRTRIAATRPVIKAPTVSRIAILAAPTPRIRAILTIAPFPWGRGAGSPPFNSPFSFGATTLIN